MDDGKVDDIIEFLSLELNKVTDTISKVIVLLERKQKFAIGTVFVTQIANAVSFVMALSLNNAFQKTFELIKIRGSPILGVWIYCLVVIPLGLLLLWLIYSFLLPPISAWLDPK